MLTERQLSQMTSPGRVNFGDSSSKQEKLSLMTIFHNIYGGPKSKPQTFVYIVDKYGQFSDFFHRQILWKICNEVITKYTTLYRISL